jgi:hypothetical protein
MTATSASQPPLILTFDEPADAPDPTPEELAGALERGHALGVIRLLPDHEGGPSVLLPASVAQRLGVSRAEPRRAGPKARSRSRDGGFVAVGSHP